VVGNNQAVVGRLLARLDLQLDTGAASSGWGQGGAPAEYSLAGKGERGTEGERGKGRKREGRGGGGRGEGEAGKDGGEGAGDARARLEVWEDDMSDLVAGQGGLYYIMHSSTNGWYVFAASAVHSIHRVAVGARGKMPQRLCGRHPHPDPGGATGSPRSPQRTQGRGTDAEGTPGPEGAEEIPTLGIPVSALSQGPWKRLTKSEARARVDGASLRLPLALGSRLAPPALTGDASWLASAVPGAAGELRVDLEGIADGAPAGAVAGAGVEARKAYKMSRRTSWGCRSRGPGEAAEHEGQGPAAPGPAQRDPAHGVARVPPGQQLPVYLPVCLPVLSARAPAHGKPQHCCYCCWWWCRCCSCCC